jgi:hypothetical protein
MFEDENQNETLPPSEAVKAQAWDAMVRILQRSPEWTRGRVLASDGRLLEWVLRCDPANENNMPR